MASEEVEGFLHGGKIPIMMERSRRQIGWATIDADGFANLEFEEEIDESLIGDDAVIHWRGIDESPEMIVSEPPSQEEADAALREQLVERGASSHLLKEFDILTGPPPVVHLFTGHVDEATGESVLTSDISLCCGKHALDRLLFASYGTVIPAQATCPELKQKEIVNGG